MRLQEILVEGLINSVQRETLKKLFSRQFPETQLEFSFSPNQLESASIEIPKDAENLYSRIVKFLNLVGWFVSRTRFPKGTDVRILTIEPRYDIVLEDVPNFLYHVTPKKSVSKILEIGLTPRSSKSSSHQVTEYPDRVYLTTSQSAARRIANIFSMGSTGHQSGDRLEYVLLQVDTTKLSDKIKFYYDVNYVDPWFESYSVYTTNNIPPRSISVL